MRKCKNCGADIYSTDTKCKACGAEILPTAGQVASAGAYGCWRLIKIVVGIGLIFGGLPILFTPGLVGGIVMIVVGGGVLMEALEG